MDRFLTPIVNFVTNEYKTTGVAIGGFTVGRLAEANILLQHLAFIFTILAAIFTMVNLFFPLRIFYTEYRQEKQKKQSLRERIILRVSDCDGMCNACDDDLKSFCTKRKS